MMLSSRRCTATSWLTKKNELEISSSTDQGGGKRCHSIERATDRSPTDWRFLHRGNDRDVLQRDHRAEHEWLYGSRHVSTPSSGAASSGVSASSGGAGA